MLNEKAHTVEVWAKLLLSAEDRRRIRDFFVSECGIRKGYVVRHMHLTVYHARRPLPGLVGVREPASVILSAAETKFMPMTPGGENPRPEIEPAHYPIGIRTHPQTEHSDAGGSAVSKSSTEVRDSGGSRRPEAQHAPT